MCGIAGKLYFDRYQKVSERDLRMMIDTLIHRGPDGEGIWCKDNVGLGHRRLIIIDRDTAAGQPMSNEDGTVWVSYNGEIYNFQELRQELIQNGHIFRTKCDTEVIVHAYEQYGRDCVQYFRGMFAFAVWDTRSRKLLLARDRVGKKPLFYYRDQERFVFASEIKAILKDPLIPKKPDPQSIDHFLAFGYIPGSRTIFQGIYKLPAAHWLEIHGETVETERYWKLSYFPKHQLNLKDALVELQERFAEAVQVRLISDVPLGAFLSGGIDSSAVVAAMAKIMKEPVRTFSAGFDEEAFDERVFARQVANKFKTDHTELIVKASVVDLLPRIVWFYDEPFGDSSAIPSFAIAELTRKYVTVALNGDGGDENFAGYSRYKINQLAYRGDCLPMWLRRGIAAVVDGFPSKWRERQPLLKIDTVAKAMAQRPEYRYLRWIGHLSTEERMSLYTDDFRAVASESDADEVFAQAFQQSHSDNWVDATLNADVEIYLTDDLLVKMDRATMAHSLETRSPFLDHRYMEFVAQLPAALKLDGGESKVALKAALRGILPDSILDRPKKGFDVPLAGWFREDLRDMTHDVLLSQKSLQRGYFQSREISRMLEEHDKSLENHSEDLWDLLVLELWHRTFID